MCEYGSHKGEGRRPASRLSRFVNTVARFAREEYGERRGYSSPATRGRGTGQGPVEGADRVQRLESVSPSHIDSALSPARISAAVWASAPSDATADPTALAACGRP